MKVDAEVLAFTSIKRRKPWPVIRWVGKEKESLLLLDECRVSVLYIPSGKTKRKIPKLSPLVEESIAVSVSPNGHYLVGLLKSGTIFLWDKDRDIVKSVEGLSQYISLTTLLTESCQIYSSHTCNQVLLVVGNKHFLVWKSRYEDVYDIDSDILDGDWQYISVPSNIHIPTSDSLELSTSGIFYKNPVCGDCCIWSMVFNLDQNVCITSLFLRFPSQREIVSEKLSSVHVEWCCLQYPVHQINANCEPINGRGAYLTSYSNDGQVLAVAVNQRSPAHSSILFISPLTDTVLVSDMKGCGLKEPENKMGRKYWLHDMAWTVDDIFVACILNNGCVCLVTRLGEPMILCINGCNIDLGPNYFLSLHPLAHVQNSENAETSEMLSYLNDPMSQKFSVTCHPSLPILIFSDGFNVTAIHLPAELTTASLMRDLILESNKHLEYVKNQRNLDLTFSATTNLNQSVAVTERRTSSTAERLKQFLENLENEDISADSVSEMSTIIDEEYNLGLQNVSSGKIVFGENQNNFATLHEFLFKSNSESTELIRHFQSAKLNLFTVWKLAASYSDNWTSSVDTIVKHCVKNIYKMFILMLNSQTTDLFTGHKSDVQNENLVIMISVYRQFLEILQFDSLQQHLISPTLQLTHKTIQLILNNTHIKHHDPRLKTLSGCFMLLKFTEKTMNRNYVWLPKTLAEKGISPRSALNLSGIDITDQQSVLTSTDKLSAKRLSATWKMLYENILEFRRDGSISEADYQQSQLLVNAIRQSINISDSNITELNKTDGSYSIDGQYTQALDVWLQQYRNLHVKGFEKSARLLHSLLYTFLLRGDLLTAVEFIDDLVIKSNSQKGVEDINPRQALMTIVTSTLKSQTGNVYDEVPCIKDKDVRLVVQSMARYMMSYFSNQSIYIFPPHNPQPLPTVHIHVPVINNRIIPQYAEEITGIINSHNLSDLWSIERTLEYLLLSGLICEATWFVEKMGDWKASYLLSVACVQHRQTAPAVYSKPRKPLTLPDELIPVSILKQKLNGLLNTDDILIDNETDTNKLTSTTKELFTAGIMCKVQVVPWLLMNLVNKLKSLVQLLTPLVPIDYYLPSPPLYCPQPTNIKQHPSAPGIEREERIREQVSSIIQLILVVLNASHLSIPCMNWYIQHLVQIQDKAKQFRANTEGPCLDIPSILQQYIGPISYLSQYINDADVQQVLISFRDFSTILWLLHARDKLSLKLRQKEKYLTQMTRSVKEDGTEKDEQQQKWEAEIFTTLQWAVHILSFSRFLPDENCMFKIVLSLLMELPPSEDTADILAEHFYDTETLDPEIQEKLDKILTQWEAIIVTPEDDGKSARNQGDDSGTDVRKSVTFYAASPRGKSLSSYYSKQCHVVRKVLKKKARKYGSFEEYIFSNTHQSKKRNAGLNIGSRQFETKQSYFEFLDTFSAVCFEKILELERSVNRPTSLPLLTVFADAIISKELAVFSEREFQNVEKKKYSLVVLSASRTSLVSSPAFARSSSIITQKYNSNLSLNQESPQTRPQGLFRSKSVVENKNIKQSVVKRYNSEGGSLDAIVEDEHMSVNFTTEPKSPHRNSHNNITNLASKFSQSEDALYKPTQDENKCWTLDVNFGRKYKLLQLLLEWLEVWCRKNHTFGIDIHDAIESKPTIKMQIPAQMILLSLWLLEHRYYVPIVKDAGQGHIVESPRRQKISKKKSKVKDISPNSSPQKPLSSSSLKMSTFEEEGIRSVYQQFLDVEKGNTSLNMSSVRSDDLDGELKQSLSIIRGTGSPTRELSTFNRTLYPSTLPERNTINSNTTTREHQAKKHKQISHKKGQRSSKLSTMERKKSHQQDQMNISSSQRSSPHSSPDQSRNSSLERASILKSSLTSSLERSTSPRNTKLHTRLNSRSVSPQLSVRSNRSRSRSPGVKQNVEHVSRRQTFQESPQQNANLDVNIATQLENIVRTEMRRIMEVQHQSLMAMMGAIDGPTASIPQQVNRVQSLSPQRRGTHSHSTRTSPVRSNQDLKHSTIDHSMNLSELERSSSHSGGRAVKMDRALLELKNLQNTTSEHQPKRTSKTKKSIGKENPGFPLLGLSGSKYIISENNQIVGHQINQVNVIPKFLHMTAERDTNPQPFFFPKILHQAWPDQGEVRSVREQEPLKLLKLQDPNYSSFKNMSHPVMKHHRPLQPTETSRQNLVSKNSQGKFGMPLLRLEARPEPAVEREAQFGQLLDLKTVQGSAPVPTEPSPHDLQQKRKDEIIAETSKEIAASVKPKKSPRRKKIITPRTEDIAEEDEDEDDDDDDDEGTTSEEEQEELHDGYVFKPGEFDSHLRIDQVLGPDADTDTRFQYMLAMKMKQQRLQKKQRKKVDFSTMTKEMIDAIAEPDPIEEAVRRADAWTSITKDTGCDPIHEAVVEYNKGQGHIVPPDIYLKLGYNDGQSAEDRGRSYLNVVDISASAVFKDIPERDESIVKQPDINLQPSTVPLTSEQDLEAIEESIREKLKPVSPSGRYGYDSVTAKMLDRKNRFKSEESLPMGYIPRESLRYSKTALIKRLKDMNDQVEAIDELSLHIQQDFDSSKKIMKTIETLDKVEETELLNDDVIGDEDERIYSKTSSPKHSPDKLTPQSSMKSPVASSRASARSKHIKTPEKPASDKIDVHMSGLSGVSDIIGEILLDGGVDLQQAGLTPTQAEIFKERARTRQVLSGSTGMEQLEDLLQQTEATDDEREKKRILHKWMNDRRIKQQEEYRIRRDRLREQEHQPFKPTTGFDSTLTGKQLQNQVKENKEMRKIQEAEFMKQRFAEAERLMGDILVDKVNMQQPLSSRKPQSTRSIPQSTKSMKPTLGAKFGTTRTIKKSQPTKKSSLQTIIKTSQFKRQANAWDSLRPKPSSLSTKWRVDGRVPANVKAANEALRFQKEQEAIQRQLDEDCLAELHEKYDLRDDLVEAEDFFIPSVSMSEELVAYTRQVQEQEQQETIPPSPKEPQQSYKPKPFTQLVKVQRPEITRKEVNVRPSESYTDRLVALSPRDTQRTEKTEYRRSTSTPAPHKSEISGIRRVKTYSERLKELKPSQKYNTPIVPRQITGGASGRPSTVGPIRQVKPARKAMTYVQQLQNINKQAPKQTVKRATRIPPRTFMKSHKPIHKPKTYGEQLRTINANAPETMRRTMQTTKRLSHGGGTKEQLRSRPYKDPYHDIEDEDELHSILSSWSVDDDVKRLLYNDTSISYNGHGVSSPSDDISDYYDAVMGEGYSASVDIDEITKIADAASIDSGSVMSVIDWDVVEDLIATVHD